MSSMLYKKLFYFCRQLLAKGFNFPWNFLISAFLTSKAFKKGFQYKF